MKIYSSETKAHEINNIEEWFNLCPPKKGKEQWVDYRSAKEMAKFWIDESNQRNFAEFIRQKFEHFEFDYIVPEHKSSFDNFNSPRQHDLVISEKTNEVIITVEGKSDESFGNDSFAENFKKAIDKKLQKKKGSMALDRMINLYEKYFQNDENILEIMYQLTHWFAGSLIDGIKWDTKNVIMVLQEFQSKFVKMENINANHNEFEKFIKFISCGEYSSIKGFQIIGPLNNIYTNKINLFIGYYPIELK